MSKVTIHDLIYFDFEKASSIWSQFQWGQSQSITTTQDDIVDKKVKGSLGFPGYAGFSGEKGQNEKTSIIETKILHHDLLNRVEALLLDADLVIDLDKGINKDETSPEVVRSAIGVKPYVKAHGWSVIEDYIRILSVIAKFPNIMDLIAYSQLETLRKNPEIAQLEKQLSDKRKEIERIKDRNKRAVEKGKLDSIEKQFNELTKQQLANIDPKLIETIELFINTFIPNRINFRVYPFTQCPSFQILCNLKRECFVDQDLEHLLYGYSNRPNVQLSVFGLVTSIPPKDGSFFDPMSEFLGQSVGNAQLDFEKSIRELFSTMDNFESFMRYSRYPNITVHPIAVYRDFSNISEEETTIADKSASEEK